MPSEPRSGLRSWRNPRTWVTLAVALLFALVLWWLESGDPAPSGPASGATSSTSPTAAPSTPDRAPQVGPAQPTRAPSQEPSGASDGPRAGDRDPHSGLVWVELDDLPTEAGEVAEAIEDGGPFVADKDGSTFGNFEGILPTEPRGYYREYTVPTPGLTHRGARRLVSGEDGELYWTADHYESFDRVLP